MNEHAEPLSEDEEALAALAHHRTGHPVPEEGRWRTFCHPSYSWRVSRTECFPPCLVCSHPANWIILAR
jgi:hypothetical protein